MRTSRPSRGADFRAGRPAACLPARSNYSIHRPEGVRPDVVRDAASLADALDLVERPMDAEVDAALAVLLLGLRERTEAARQQRPHLPVVAHGHAVELVGRERERDVVA